MKKYIVIAFAAAEEWKAWLIAVTSMKKYIVIAFAALLVSGIAFAHDGKKPQRNRRNDRNRIGSLGIRVVNTRILRSPVHATTRKGTRPREFPKSHRIVQSRRDLNEVKAFTKEKSDQMAVRVLLEKQNGTLEPVSPEHQFRVRDRIRVEVASKFAGYLYLINIGSSGRNRVLGEKPAKVAAGSFTCHILEFDEHKGTDVLRVYLSRRPIRILENAQSRKIGLVSENELAELTRDSLEISDENKYGIAGFETPLPIETVQTPKCSRQGEKSFISTRSPTWNEEKKITLVQVRKKKGAQIIKGRLSANEIAVFGLSFQNLGNSH
jgi:hypothetical protein